MNNDKIKPQFHFEKIGCGNNKLICIHGFGASGKTFNDIKPFFGSSYEIYMFDLIGFGNSKFVEGWEYTIRAQAKLLYEFIKEHKLNDATLLGHSYGGGVVLLLLVMLRELGNEIKIKKAILIGPACYPQNIPFFIRIPGKHPKLYSLFMKFVPKKVLAKYMLKNMYINKELINDEKIERYASYFVSKDNIKGIIETAKNILPVNVDEIIEKIKFIDIPILILWGDKDFIIKKKNIYRLNEDIRNSKLIVVENTGHVVQEEKPELVYKEIEKFIV